MERLVTTFEPRDVMTGWDSFVTEQSEIEIQILSPVYVNIIVIQKAVQGDRKTVTTLKIPMIRIDQFEDLINTGKTIVESMKRRIN